MLVCKGFASFNELLQRAQTGRRIVAQTARVIKNNVLQGRAALAYFKQLVDLLLVLDDCNTHVGVGDRKHAFSAHGVLVQRHWYGAYRLRRQHGGIQARPVAANHHHVLAATQAKLVQAAGDVCHQSGHAGPTVGLPDTVLFFPHRRGVGTFSRVLEQQLWEGGLSCAGRGGLHRPCLSMCSTGYASSSALDDSVTSAEGVVWLAW